MSRAALNPYELGTDQYGSMQPEANEERVEREVLHTLWEMADDGQNIMQFQEAFHLLMSHYKNRVTELTGERDQEAALHSRYKRDASVKYKEREEAIRQGRLVCSFVNLLANEARKLGIVRGEAQVVIEKLTEQGTFVITLEDFQS